MEFGQYFRRSKGSFPAVGVVGVESDWMDVGEMQVASGTLWAGDPYLMDNRRPKPVDVPKGTYRVQIKGADFKGHRRTAAVRVWRKGPAEPGRAPRALKTITDCGWIGVCDFAAYRKAVPVKRAEEFARDIIAATQGEGIGILHFDYGAAGFDMSLQPSGLGDGTFALYPLLVRGKPAGVEVEFLPAGFRLDSEIPGMRAAPAGRDKKKAARTRQFLKACEDGKVDVVRKLLKEDPDLVHARGGMGMSQAMSPLHLAAVFDHADVAEVLLKNGHPVEATDDDGKPPLWDACKFGGVKVVRVLLKRGAKADLRDPDDRSTPLHEAAWPGRNRAAIVRMLLAAGADPAARNSDRQTPLAVAREYVNNPNFAEHQGELRQVIEILSGGSRKK